MTTTTLDAAMLSFHISATEIMNSSLNSQMVVIDLVDEPLPEGNSHTMAIRIWTSSGISDPEWSAQLLALSFLERATVALRKQLALNPENGYQCERA